MDSDQIARERNSGLTAQFKYAEAAQVNRIFANLE